MTKNLYDTLGVKKNASKSDIKNAYHKKAMEHHPDKGGDNEKMMEIVKAYSVLGDDNKKRRYDTTGETEATPFDRKFQEFIQKFLVHLVETTNVDSTNIIGKLEEIAKQNIKGTKEEIKNKRERLRRFEVVVMRLEAKGEDKIGVIVNGNIDMLKNEIGQLDEHIEFMGQVLECLGSYMYNYDTVKENNDVYWNFVVNGNDK